MLNREPVRTRKCLYSINPLGVNLYRIGWIDAAGAHEEVWVGDLLPRLIEMGLVTL